MESCSDISVVEPSATYSLVLFHDIPHTYPPSTQVTCQYTLTAGFLPNTRDWVGVFKVGWSSTKDYHTFVWVEPYSDVEREEPVKKQVIFNEYYLPKDDAEFYQFCYVDSSGQVRGASTPFCFKEEPSVDCSLEADLLVITTQEQVEQSARERDELQKEVDQMRLQNESIKSALMEKQREVDHLKEQQDGSEQERKELGEELSQTKQQNESLRSNLREQQQELDRVKEDLVQKAHQLEQQHSREEEKLSQSLKSVDEQEVKQKYDRAVVKINQLKQEREELNGKLDIQSVEIAELKPKVREQEQELLKLRDVIQLLQEQQDGSEQERKELGEELSQTKQQNESLRSNLREQQQELDRVKEDLIQKAHQLEQQNSREEGKLSQSLKSVDESQREQEVKQKYNRAVVKINQLKQEREELNGKLDIQSVEIAELKPKVREQEQELLKQRDVIQLLQVDLQSSEKEKERLHVELRRLHELTHNVDELKRENEELRRSQQETLQNIPDEDMKVRYQTLLNQLQEARAQLSDERQLSNSAQRQLEHLDRELLDTKEQLDRLALSSDQSKRCSSKLELRLTEAHSTIAEMNINATEMDNRITIEQQEKEELERQIRNLQRDNDRFGRELAEQIASAADSLYMQPSSPHGFSPEAMTTSSQGQQQDTLPESLQYDEALFETIGTIADTEEEESFVCRHCQETFPGFTREERVLHEQSHQVCPFCTLICDSMEQSVFEDHVYSHEL